MAGIRRAFLVTTLERYLLLAVQLGLVAVVSRLLTPAEIGLAVLGMSLLAMAETLRDFGTGTYLIQAREVGRERVRTAFTVMVLVSTLIVAVIFACADLFAGLYGEARLAPYLRLIAVGFLLGPLSAPILALLRREMAFGAVALIGIASSLASAGTTIGLALLGHGYMSFAWGGIAWNAVAAVLAITVRPDTSIFRFRLTDWRSILAFGGYSSATVILNRMYEVLPYLALGRLQAAATVGLYNRTLVLCQIPERALLAGVVNVALPALSAEVRAGRSVKQPYLRAISYLTVVQWPVLVLVALLAHPIIDVLLGPQWLSIVPLVQIVALAQAFAFAAPLTFPVLVALGGIRDTLISSLLALPLSAVVVLVASSVGLEALAASMLFTVPLQIAIALHFVQRRVQFRWRELGASMAKSGAISVCSAVAPLAALALNGFRPDLPLATAILAGAGWALCWATALLLLRHPFADELRRVLLHLHAAAPRPDWTRRLATRAGLDTRA